VNRSTDNWWTGQYEPTSSDSSVSKLEQLGLFPQLCERIRTLAATGLNATEIANQLNQEGFHHQNTALGLSLQARTDATSGSVPASQGDSQRNIGRARVVAPRLARLEIPDGTLYSWVQRGWIKARQQISPYRLIAWADEAEVEQLKQFRQLSFSDRMRQQWLEKSSIRHVDTSIKTPVRNCEYVYPGFMRIRLAGLCAYCLVMRIRLAGLCAYGVMNHNRALQHPQRS